MPEYFHCSLNKVTPVTSPFSIPLTNPSPSQCLPISVGDNLVFLGYLLLYLACTFSSLFNVSCLQDNECILRELRVSSWSYCSTPHLIILQPHLCSTANVVIPQSLQPFNGFSHCPSGYVTPSSWICLIEVLRKDGSLCSHRSRYCRLDVLFPD